MRKTAKSADSGRRTPKQARSRDTIDVVFEATARILVKEGRAALTTNHIAERAGISVGTLYQYFPNKDAILLEMARREMQKATAAVLEAVSAEACDPVTAAIRPLIGLFGNRRKARNIVFHALIAAGYGQELERNLDGVAEALVASASRISPRRILPPVTAFILTRAVNGVLVSASRDESGYIDTPEFEAELVRLVRRFLEG